MTEVDACLSNAFSKANLSYRSAFLLFNSKQQVNRLSHAEQKFLIFAINFLSVPYFERQMNYLSSTIQANV